MRAMPFGLPGKGVIAVSEFLPEAGYWKSISKQEGSEPTSVLDTRRSPSPPSSTSTLSSSAEAPGVAAVSEKPPLNKWPPSQLQQLQQQQQDDVSAAGGGGGRGEEWASSELQPVPACLEIGGEKCGLGGMEDCWDNMLAGSTASPPPGNEHSFFRWFMGDVEDPTTSAAPSHPAAAAAFGLVDPDGFGIDPAAELSPPPVSMNAAMNPAADFLPFGGNNGRLISASNLKGAQVLGGDNNGGNSQSPIFPNHPMNHPAPISLPAGVFFRQQQQLEAMSEKTQLYNPLINLQQTHPAQNPTFLLPLPSFAQQDQPPLPPQAKRHHSAIPNPNAQIPRAPFQDPSFSQLLAPPHTQLHHLQQRPAKPKAAGDEEAALAQQLQAFLGQLCKAAELVEAGNVLLARGILARLNHHQLSPYPSGRPPLLRAAFCFKEALQLLLDPSATTNPPFPVDVVLKISAYKAFSETSPILQFANFTCNQALLEALDGFNRIHIVDFDIGFGGQWASFIQELALKLGGSLALKITAFASSATHDPLELGLTRESLTHFAADLDVPFEFNAISLDSCDPSSALLALSDNEAVAVNLPLGTTGLPVPALLRLVRQLKPKILVSVDHGSDRSELPFSHHFIHSLESYSILLDSIDAINTNTEVVQKIEKYLVKPRIENLVSGRHRAGEKLLPWRTLFASAGFLPIPFSNFTETQAECLVTKLQVRGFQVEKRQASLCLLWQRGDLVSVSAWRC